MSKNVVKRINNVWFSNEWFILHVKLPEDLIHRRKFKRFLIICNKLNFIDFSLVLLRMETATLTSRSWTLSWRTSMIRTTRWERKRSLRIITVSHISRQQIQSHCIATLFDLRRWTPRAWPVTSKASWPCRTEENCTAQSWRSSSAGTPCCEPPAQLCPSCLNTVTVCMCRAPRPRPVPIPSPSWSEFWMSVRRKAQICLFFPCPKPNHHCFPLPTNCSYYDALCSIFKLYI